ncbi:CrcB family protein [Mailhella sp.]|uniref:CrcB family protein n=1 Tax=Mailhella sp. TaxID=1981029 RepID=UPI004062CFEF
MHSNLLLSLPVMLGGALGALCRVKADAAVSAAMGGHFPLGILCVNMAGSLLMGLLMGGLSRLEDSVPAPAGETARSAAEESAAWLGAFFGTGFLGGFTTFSSFALDTVRLWQEGHAAFSLLNIGLNAALCIGLAGLGWMIAAPKERRA